MDLANSTLEAIFIQELPVGRSHEFYNVIMGISGDLGWWHSARAAAAEMTETARWAGFWDLRFTNMVRWAQLALRCGDQPQSRELFEQAIAYYATLAPSENRAWAEIGFAEATRDESRFAKFAPELEMSKDSITWIPYQRVRSELAVERGRLGEARERLVRIVAWMKTPEASHPSRSLQWHAEFRATEEVFLDLMLRQGQIREAFDLLQQWRLTEELELANVRDPARTSADGALAFVFVPVGNRFAAWRVDGEAVDFRWASAPRSEVERLARCLHRLMASPESDRAQISAFGTRIREALFGSWLDSIASDRALIIQTEETLADLAFAALPTKGEPLGLEHPISVTPFALSKGVGESHPTLTHTKVLLVDASLVNPEWASELPSLAGADREIDSVQQAMLTEVQVIRGGEVTANAIARHGSSASVLHFVGHAVKTAIGVGLLLPNSPTPQRLQDLRQLGFRPPPIMVLSACSTGERTQTDSFGPDSLATEFLLEGSGEVIASLWHVDSESTAELMAEFYRQLGSGSRSGRALQSAMRVVRGSDRYAHPYYWASFARFVRV
jgi:hypothetical protein